MPDATPAGQGLVLGIAYSEKLQSQKCLPPATPKTKKLPVPVSLSVQCDQNVTVRRLCISQAGSAGQCQLPQSGDHACALSHRRRLNSCSSGPYVPCCQGLNTLRKPQGIIKKDSRNTFLHGRPGGRPSPGKAAALQRLGPAPPCPHRPLHPGAAGQLPPLLPPAQHLRVEDLPAPAGGPAPGGQAGPQLSRIGHSNQVSMAPFSILPISPPGSLHPFSSFYTFSFSTSTLPVTRGPRPSTFPAPGALPP